jgi:hypothetical protein
MRTSRMSCLVGVLGLLALLNLPTGAALAADGVPAVSDARLFSLLDEITIPQEWAGIWESDIDVYDCDTNFLLFSSTELDTMCTGGPVMEPDEGGEIQITCTGTVDGNNIDIQCSGSAVIGPDCTAEIEWVSVGTRDGDSMTSTTTVTTTYVGAGCEGGPSEFCIRSEASGTRIGPEPEDCDFVANEVYSWSTIKGLYR